MSEPNYRFSLGNTHAKVPKAVLRDFVVGIASALFVLIITLIIIWSNREALFARIARDYMTEQSTVSDGGTLQEVSPLGSNESFVINAVKHANPAVVSIVITKDVPKYQNPFGSQESPFNFFFGPNDLFNQFFGQMPESDSNSSGETEKQEIGGGSGFLVSKDGLIVTNRHVVEDEDAEYTVYTNDGKKYTAKVLARDGVLDVAVIKITGEDFPYLSLGDSDKIMLGQSAIAIGNALGEFKNSVSVGVISGLSRSLVASDGFGTSEQLDRVIQTDAAINPGNSGGPLINLSGEVIGVNVAVAQGSQSIGFALPINSVKSAIISVEESGTIVRPHLGIRYVAITPELADANYLEVDYGILVQRGANPEDLAVIPGSPADKAGIVENDIILEIDGQKIDEDTNFAFVIRDKDIGDVITLKILSKGKEKTVQATLEKAPEN